MEECSDELRGLEDGYRQKHRDAKQVRMTSARIPVLSTHESMGERGDGVLPPLCVEPRALIYTYVVVHGSHAPLLCCILTTGQESAPDQKCGVL